MDLTRKNLSKIEYRNRYEADFLYNEKDLEELILRDIKDNLEKLKSTLIVKNLKHDHTQVIFRINECGELYATAKLVFIKEGLANGEKEENKKSIPLHEVSARDYGKSVF